MTVGQTCPAGHRMSNIALGNPAFEYDYACSTCGHREYKPNKNFKGPNLSDTTKFLLGIAESGIKEAKKQVKVEAESLARQIIKEAADRVLGRKKRSRRR